MAIDIHSGGLERFQQGVADLREVVANCTETVQSDNHEFVVTVTPGGAVARIEFSERIFAHTCESASKLVTITIQRAVRQLAESLAEQTHTLVKDQVNIAGVWGGRDSRDLVHRSS